MSKRLMVLFAVFALAAASAVAGEADDTASASAIAALPNPLKDAKVGQWVQYRINTLFGTADQKQTLVGIEGEGDERVLTIKSEMSIDDELVDERTDAITYKQALEEQEKALADSGEVSVKNVSLEFKGNTYDVVEVDFIQDEKHCVLYLSEKVPLVGMIRMTMEGQDGPVMELVDFGE